MGQFKTHAVRRDAAQPQASNHVHSLPDGHVTEGMIEKPAKDYYGLHTHLYQFEDQTLETEPAYDGPGHVHMTELGESSGPVKPEKAPGEPWQKMDSAMFKGRLQRQGSQWVAISYAGQVLGSAHRQDAAQHILDLWETEDAELRRA